MNENNISDNDSRTYVYHEITAPKGIVVSASEAKKLYKKGWVDSPTKFGKGIWGKWHKIILFCRALEKFYLEHWKWMVGLTVPSILTIIIIYIMYLQLKQAN